MASNLVNLVATGLAMADVSQTNRWREEDLIQRKLENTRRDIDEKLEQLRAISQLAALIAGFDIVVLIELDIPPDAPEFLLVLLGLSSALTVCLMSLSFMLSTLMLVGILKAFDINTNRRQTFRDFWILRCEDDWRRAFKLFTLGVPSFMINLAFAAWVKFFSKSKLSASFVTFIVFLALINWIRMHQKWGSFLSERSSIPRPQYSPNFSENVQQKSFTDTPTYEEKLEEGILQGGTKLVNDAARQLDQKVEDDGTDSSTRVGQMASIDINNESKTTMESSKRKQNGT